MSEELEFIEMPSVDDVKPLEAVPTGEYDLICVDVKFGIDKNEHFFMQPRFKILNELNSKTFTKYIPMPAVDMDEDKLDSTQRQLKYFADWMELPAIGGQLTKDALKGKKGRAILRCVGSEEDEYGIQNEIAKYL